MIDPILTALNDMDFTIKVRSDRYYNKDGANVPRVTEILSSTIHSDGLMYWANNIGLKGMKYRDVMNAASTMGTAAHDAIELFLKEKFETHDNIPLLGFLMWYNQVSSKFPIEVIFIEEKMAGRWFGGTLDCLLKIGNKIYLIDFKTSNHITFNYFLQLASYEYLLKELYGISVDGMIVLQLDKTEPGFNEYLLEFSVLEHRQFMDACLQCFLSLVYAFYNTKRIESWYRTIF